jgi:hypothetical protein
LLILRNTVKPSVLSIAVASSNSLKQGMKMSKPLNLATPVFSSHLARFLSTIQTAKAQQSFRTDPAGTAVRAFNLKVPQAQISASNTLIAILLGSVPFVSWCQEFQKQFEAENPEIYASKNLIDLEEKSKVCLAKVQRAFADGVVAHLSPDALAKAKVAVPNFLQGAPVAAEADIAIFLLVFVLIFEVIGLPIMQGALLGTGISRATLQLIANQLAATKTPGVKKS